MRDVEPAEQIQEITEQEVDLPVQRAESPLAVMDPGRWRYRSAVDVARALNRH